MRILQRILQTVSGIVAIRPWAIQRQKTLLSENRHLANALKNLQMGNMGPLAFVMDLSAPRVHLKILLTIFPILSDIHLEVSCSLQENNLRSCGRAGGLRFYDSKRKERSKAQPLASPYVSAISENNL